MPTTSPAYLIFPDSIYTYISRSTNCKAVRCASVWSLLSVSPCYM